MKQEFVIFLLLIHLAVDFFQASLVSNGSVHQEVLSSPSSDKFIEAYVSAVESATHFWLQVGCPVLPQDVVVLSVLLGVL